MKGRAISYSAAELTWIEANATLSIGDLAARFRTRFQRSDVTAVNLASLRKRKGWKTGRSGRFVRGGTPANKGQRMPYNPNSAATRFKAGNRTGRAEDVYKPVGSERLSKEGYLERKIHDGMPFQSRWKAVHRLRWEELHGPVPTGHALKCLDGDRRNTAPDNWQLVPRSMLPRLNGGRHKRRLAYDDAPAELKPTVMAIARLEQAIDDARGGAT